MFTVPFSCEVWSDVQAPAGRSHRWGGASQTTTAAAAAAAPNGRPLRLVLPHQGAPRLLPTAPSAHDFSLHLLGRFWAVVFHFWCSPLPGVLPQPAASVRYDLQKLRRLALIQSPPEGGHQWTRRYERWCPPLWTHSMSLKFSLSVFWINHSFPTV